MRLQENRGRDRRYFGRQAALTQAQREQQEAAIMIDHLMVERLEVALIRLAEGVDN